MLREHVADAVGALSILILLFLAFGVLA